MKFSVAAVFVTGALATPTLVARQVSNVIANIATISSATTDLDTSINAFTGPSDVQGLIDASNNVVSAIQAGTATASGLAPLSTEDAFSLIDPITNLIGIVNKTVTDLNGKKSLFQSNGLCGQVVDQVTAQQNAAQDFQNALIPKTPESIQDTARGLASEITKSLAQAASTFKSCATTTPTTSSTSSTTSSVITTTYTTTGPGGEPSTCTTTTTPPPPPAYPTSTPVPPAYPSSSPVVPPAYPSSTPVVPPSYPSSSPVVPPSYNSSTPAVPPPYPTSTPGGSVPPSYTTSTPAGSVPPSYPSSTPVLPPNTPPSTPGTPGTPTTPTGPTTSSTIIPSNPNAGAKQVAGLGSVAFAAIIAIAAF